MQVAIGGDMVDTHIRSWPLIAKLFMLACGMLLCTSHVMAANGVTVTAATGGTAISADTTGGTYTALTGPTIAENGPQGIATTGTIILNAPSGFIFDTGTNVTATVSSCSSGAGSNMLLGNSPGSSSQTVTPTTSTITINVFQVSSQSIKCTLTWSNINVRPTSSTPLASGNITRSGTATMTENPATTNYGSLTEVAGATKSFNAVETAANAVTGNIFTKIAGQNFAFDIVALNASNAISTAFTGTVTVEVVDSSSGGACASLPLITTFTNQTFVSSDAGRHALTSPNTESNSWPNARVRIKYPISSPTIISCSTDNFAIRPASLASFSVTDGDWQTAGTARALGNTAATGGNVHKAGLPFTLQATAVNALMTPTTTTNYTGTPTTVLTACSPGTGCTTAFGTVSIGSSAVAGVINSTTATYSEVGSFTLQLQDQTFANVDASDGSTTAQRYITSATLDVGRFVPDHFDGAVSTTPILKTFNNTACASRSFTYIGQPFGYVTLPQATFTAKNFSGVTTANYKSSLWKLGSSDVSQIYAYTLTPAGTPGLTTTIGTATVTSNSNGTGTVTPSSGDTLTFTRLASAQTPFTAAIDLTVSVSDSSESAVTGNGTITTTATALFSSMSFDSGNAFRYGRLQMQNAYGSELLNLPVPLEAQYWNGSAYVRNAGDSCTTIPPSSLIYSGFQSNLAACKTHTVLSGAMTAGQANLSLTAPGSGYSGSVNLAINVGATASGNTCASSSSTSATAANMPWFGTNPAAKATFGIYKTPLIYLRENF